MMKNKAAFPFFCPLILLTTSVLLALFMGEGIVRIVAPQNLTGTWFDFQHGIPLNRANHKTRHQFGERIAEYRINDLHMRGGPVDGNTPRLLVVGDSFTFGLLLNEQDTIASHLQKFAEDAFGKKKIQFLNGGAGGWGTADYLRFIEVFGASIKPTAIVVILNTDDIGRAIKRRIYHLQNDDLLVPVEIDAPSFGLRVKRFVNALIFYNCLLEHSHLLQLFRKAALLLIKPSFEKARQRSTELPSTTRPGSPELEIDSSQARKIARAYFIRLKKWCDGHGVELFVTTTGFFPMSSDTPIRSEPTLAFYESADQVFRKLGIPYHDITPKLWKTMAGQPEKFSIPKDGHPNEKGSREIATQVWEWLRPQLENLQLANH